MLYQDAGVKPVDQALGDFLQCLRKTFSLRTGIGSPQLGFGAYANVLALGGNQGLAITTDGVGSKILIAEMMDKYDSIGIDCVAMNVNDLLCVGAEPIALVDYIAVQEVNDRVLKEIGQGLYKGALKARISIPGGELAQLPEMIQGTRPGQGLDLVGTAIGLVPLDRILDGSSVKPGDVLIGLASSGLHSNGFSLARKALLHQGKLRLDQPIADLGRTLGEELLEPTQIYVEPILALLQSDISVKALFHITGDGFLNLSRIPAPIGFEISTLPEPQPIFHLIQRIGEVPWEEMYRVFNMGVGFCVVVAPSQAEQALNLLQEKNITAWVLGTAVKDEERKITLRSLGITLRPF